MTLPTACPRCASGDRVRRIGHDDLDGDRAQPDEESGGQKRQRCRGKSGANHCQRSERHDGEDQLAIFKEVAQRHDQEKTGP